MTAQANTSLSRRPSRGFTLIESLVGVVVLSVGLLSIASLQTGSISATGEAKARSEAMQIAEAEMESLRDYKDRADFDNIATLNGQSESLDGSDPTRPIGTNATFKIEWQVETAESNTAGDPMLYLAGIRVSWKGPQDDPNDASAEQAVTIASFIKWDSPTGGANATNMGTASGGNRIPSPSGGALDGGRNYGDDGPPQDGPDGPAERNIATVNHQEITLGTFTYTAEDGAKELIGEDGQVLLTIPTGEVFSTISGRFYAEPAGVNTDNLAITSSAGGYCEVAEFPGSDEEQDASNYRLFYICYVGPAWYGNVGVVRFNVNNEKGRVCVGRPGEETVTRWDSKHPALSTIRSYRGFKENTENPDFPFSTGIGITWPQDDPSAEDYSAVQYWDHDFLLATIQTAQPDNEDCGPKLEQHEALYNDSWGKGFCFTEADVNDNWPWTIDFCPNINEGAAQSGSTNITVRFPGWKLNQLDGAFNNGTLTGSVSMNGDTCSSETATQKDPLVVCTVGHAGIAESGFNREMSFDFAGDYILCSVDNITGLSDGTIERSGNNTIEFTGIPLSDETLELDVRVAEAGNC